MAILEYQSAQEYQVQDGRPIGIALMAMAAGMLGMALQITDGLYSPAGIALLTISLTLCGFCVLGPKSIVGASISSRRLNLFVGTMVAIQLFAMLLMRSGGGPVTAPQVEHGFFRFCVLLAAIGLATIVLADHKLRLAGFVMMLLAFTAMGIWKIRTVPSPVIDVFTFHLDAARALARGQNPYSMTFPDIYGPGGDWVYGQGIVREGRLQFGYPYPPVVLLMTSFGQWIAGDPRYAMLVAMLVSGLCIALISPGRIGMLAAALLLFTPRSFYVLEQAWTEPLSVMLLAATVLCAARASAPGYPGEASSDGAENEKPGRGRFFSSSFIPPTSFAPIFFGLFIASKQYLPAAVVLAPMLERMTRRGSRRAKSSIGQFLGIAALVAVVVTVPLALWNWKAFWYSVFELQTHQPYRPDSLSYLAWWGLGRTGWQGPFWLCFAALVIAMASCWCRGVRNFAAAFALSYFAFFAFNKQAFANYYYLILGAMSCAITSSALSASYSEEP